MCRSFGRPAVPVATVLIPVTVLVVLVGTALCAQPARAAERPVAAAVVLPGLARELLPLVSDLTARRCPDLPPLWVVAQVQADSGWDPGLHADRPGGAAGLYQLDQQGWLAAGGQPWPSDPPGPGSAVLDASTNLRVAVPWMCTTLHAVSEHLRATGKPTAPLDALVACHVAGCARVTGSRSGLPSAGEAGCDDRCARLVRRSVDAVRADVGRFTGGGGLDRGAAASPAAGPERPVAVPRTATPARGAGPDTATGANGGC